MDGLVGQGFFAALTKVWSGHVAGLRCGRRMTAFLMDIADPSLQIASSRFNRFPPPKTKKILAYSISSTYVFDFA
jgi:hypothetical protein